MPNPRRLWGFFASVTGCEWTQSKTSGLELVTSVRHGPLLCRQKMHQHFLPECLPRKRHEGRQCCHHVVSVGSDKRPPTSPGCAMRTAEGQRCRCAWPSHPWSRHKRSHAGGCRWLCPPLFPFSPVLEIHSRGGELTLFYVTKTHTRTHTHKRRESYCDWSTAWASLALRKPVRSLKA